MASVWKEGACGFYQVAHRGVSGIPLLSHRRVRITEVASAGDQVRQCLSDSLIWYKASTCLEDLFVIVAKPWIDDFTKHRCLPLEISPPKRQSCSLPPLPSPPL